MKATQFIKDHGLEKAKEVVKAAIDGTTHVIYEQAEGLINLKDLKRLVESVDLVESYGGIESCKQSLYMLHELTEDPEPVREAVRDYESIYGGRDE